MISECKLCKRWQESTEANTATFSAQTWRIFNVRIQLGMSGTFLNEPSCFEVCFSCSHGSTCNQYTESSRNGCMSTDISNDFWQWLVVSVMVFIHLFLIYQYDKNGYLRPPSIEGCGRWFLEFYSPSSWLFEGNRPFGIFRVASKSPTQALTHSFNGKATQRTNQVARVNRWIPLRFPNWDVLISPIDAVSEALESTLRVEQGLNNYLKAPGRLILSILRLDRWSKILGHQELKGW